MTLMWVSAGEIPGLHTLRHGKRRRRIHSTVGRIKLHAMPPACRLPVLQPKKHALRLRFVSARWSPEHITYHLLVPV